MPFDSRQATNVRPRDTTMILGARYVLTGGIRRAGSSVRVTAQLVDGRSDSQLWTDKFNGTLDDVFEIQERLSRQIVEALRLRLTPTEDRRLAQ